MDSGAADMNKKNARVHEIVIEEKSLTSKSECSDANTPTEVPFNEFISLSKKEEFVIEKDDCSESKVKKGGIITTIGEESVICYESIDVNIATEDPAETKGSIKKKSFEAVDIEKIDNKESDSDSEPKEMGFKPTEVPFNEFISMSKKELVIEKGEYSMSKVKKGGIITTIGKESVICNESIDVNIATEDPAETKGSIKNKYFEAVDIEKIDNNESDSDSEPQEMVLNTDIREEIDEIFATNEQETVISNDDVAITEDNSEETMDLKIQQYRMELKALTNDKSSERRQSRPPSRSEDLNTPDIPEDLKTPEGCNTPMPGSSSSSSLDFYEDEATSVVPKTKLSLPYFHLPNPKLDEFLIETEKKLSIHESNEKTPACPQRMFEPKNSGNITFDIGDAESKCDKKSRTDLTLRQKMKSINEVNDSTPGLKRCLLNDCLLKSIGVNKFAAFNQKKENERCNEVQEEVDFEVDEDEVNYESSEENDLEEAAVSFDKECVNSSRIVEYSDSSDDDQNCNHKTASKAEKRSELSNNPDYLTIDDDSVAVIDDITLPEVEAIDVVLPSKHRECQDADDEIEFVKSKKVKVLEEDSDGNDCCLIFDSEIDVLRESKAIEKPQIEEDSPDSVLFVSDVSTSSKDIDKGSCVLETNDIENVCNESSNIFSSITSYQPHGGFVCESQVEEEVDAVKAAESKIMHIKNNNYSIYRDEKESEESDSSLEAPPVEDSADAHQFGFKFDNPPVSQQENESDVFSSQDIANVCSGVFKNDQTPKFCEPGETLKSFFDIEAEVSGEDDVDDEPEEGDGDNIFDLVDDSDLPHAEEMRESVAELYMKQNRDTDTIELNLIQEHMITDGELNHENVREKKFMWSNKNNMKSAVDKEANSENSDDSADEEWNKDKVKFLKEKEKNPSEEGNDAVYKKSTMKMNIIGKTGFAKELKARGLKRSRNSYLNLDDEDASQIAKRLKATEEVLKGSRTVKHVLFTPESEEIFHSSSNDEDKNKDSTSVFSKFI